MAEKGTIQAIGMAVAKAFEPLQDILASETAFIGMMRQMGWTVEDIPGPIQDLITPLDNLVSAIQTVQVDSSVENIAELLTALANLTNAVAELEGKSFDTSLSLDGFAAEFPAQLIDYLLVEYLSQYQPAAMGMLGAFGLVQMEYQEASGNRQAFVTRKLNWEMISEVLDDPGSVLETIFGWNADEFDFEALLSELENLLAAIRIPAYLAPVYGDEAEVLEEGGEVEGDAERKRLNVPFLAGDFGSGEVEIGVGLFGLPATTGRKPGFIVNKFENFTDKIAEWFSTRSASYLLIPIGFYLFVMFYFRQMADLDLFARVAVGRLIALQGSIPLTDPFAFTETLPIWFDHEWLSGVVFYFISQVGGDFALFAFAFTMLLLCTFLIYRSQLYLTNEKHLALLWLFLTTIPTLVSRFAIVRSQVFSFLFVTLALLLLIRYKKLGDSKLLFLIPLSMVFWPTFPISTSDPSSSDLPVMNDQNLSALQPRNKGCFSYFG